MRTKKFKKPILSLVGAMLGIMPLSAVTQTCPCNYMVCALCVNTSLPAIKTATSTAFDSLSTLHTTMDQTIELGVNAEVQSITNYRNNIVSALIADSESITGTLAVNSIVESRLYEGLQQSVESIQKSSHVAKQNEVASENFGLENVSHSTKQLSNAQYAKVISRSAFDKFKGDGSEFADIAFLVSAVIERKDAFLKSIFIENEQIDTQFKMISLIKASEEIDFKSEIVNENDFDEALSYQRFIAVPHGIQSGMRDADAYISSDIGYSSIRARSKIASEFLAWDLALRSEFKTDSGSISFFQFLKAQVLDSYSSTEGMVDIVTSGDRELKNSIAANEAISNILDILLLETGSYNLQMEGAKLGAMTDEKFSGSYGYESMSLSQNTINRSNNER
ncbi:hypothetical protein [Cellvibrio sp. QJXJ]|uniref:hypothetical protein n=1 Tax=Cellvibrio sp. QJXJ TaxID=2964606 RepID=UPI0021C2B912|nr:hypothetical protein [Cellvibrio sp. QJXJ]UUA75127.1 hypothetical protein NNX04_21975 [Cellvibrio sp. QJXJ]